MNSKQYNNIINHTLVNEPAAQTEDSLTTARAIFNNMGVALPSGDLPEIMEVLQTNEYMGWKACTREEAQQAANNGIAAIGIRADQIVVLAAEDEDEPVAQTASVMTVSETSESSENHNFQYCYYDAGTTTICYVQAIQNKADAYIRIKPVTGDDTHLLDADGHWVMLKKGNPETFPLMQNGILNDGSRIWYQILYNGMVCYVAGENCRRTGMLEPNISYVREVEVSTGTIDGLGIRITPEQTGGNLIGRIPDGAIVKIMSDVKQNGNWYAVRATINDVDTFGWCLGSYLYDDHSFYRASYNDDQKAAIMSNLETFNGLSKKSACLAAAEKMLDAGYAPAIIAGMLGNINAEGEIGEFEVMNPSARLSYLNSVYAGGNFYSNHCNGKNIKDVDLSAVEGLQNWLIETTGNTFTANGVDAKFGIGVIQWTADRTTKLLEEYRRHITPAAAKLKPNEIKEAEMTLLLRELASLDYHFLFGTWVKNCRENGIPIPSAEAAKRAGYDICMCFIEPLDIVNAATSRGNKAKEIYNAMMAN